MKKIRPKLSWKLSDYKKHDIEPPDELHINPEKTEGELMEYEEVEGWVVESIKTFRVIRDDNKEVFEELYNDFKEDVCHLVKLKKISKEAADEILDLGNFEI